MRQYHVAAIFLLSICSWGIQSERSLAQVPCPGRISGYPNIPLCTGFCVNLDTSAPAHKHPKHSCRFFGDSTMKDFTNLFNSDSLQNKFRVFNFDSDGNYSFFGDSANWSGHFPDSLLSNGIIEGWTDAIPKEFHFEMPKIPEYKFYDGKTNPLITPKKEKKKTPMPGFNSWYLQELAKL